MGFFNFLKKQTPTKSPVEKFKKIIISVKSHTEFLLNGDYTGMDSKEAVNKRLYKAADEMQLLTFLT